MSENEKNREKASHLTKVLEDERLKAMEKQRLQDQGREDSELPVQLIVFSNI